MFVEHDLFIFILQQLHCTILQFHRNKGIEMDICYTMILTLKYENGYMLYNNFGIKVCKWIYVIQRFWHKGMEMDICYTMILA